MSITQKQQAERWKALEARLGRESEIWLATVRGDGRPHLVPVFFVWHDNQLYFATATNSQKWQNLLHNQFVSVSLIDPNNVVLIEGEAHAVGAQLTTLIADHFYDKYEWDFRYDDTAPQWRLVQVTPHKILAWGDGYDDLGSRIL